MIFCTICGNKLEEHQSVCPICYTSVETVDTPKKIAVAFQQEIIIPKRTKNTKKNVIIAVLLVMTLFGGVFIGFSLTYPSVIHAEDDANYWHSEYNDLQDDYNLLVADYANLFADYELLQEAFEEPLTYYVIPTKGEVQTWLYFDNTDSFTYVSGTWACGDFSAMLMTRAKTMNWRMRICTMIYSFDGDAGYGVSDMFGANSHAFNLIYCQDGNDPDSELDIYYIEPQTDKCWLRMDSSSNYLHYKLWTTYSGMSDTVWLTTHWVNYYNYFG